MLVLKVKWKLAKKKVTDRKNEIRVEESIIKIEWKLVAMKVSHDTNEKLSSMKVPLIWNEKSWLRIVPSWLNDFTFTSDEVR